MRLIYLAVLLVILSLTSACSTLNGNVHLFKEDGGYLYGPWKNAEDNKGLIKKANAIGVTNFEDTFMIQFNQAFFKYLPDLGNSNEVVVIFTFTEDGNSEDGELVKIIGPMRRLADGSFTSSVGKVAYGPKRLDSDILSVRIQIIEFDAEESDNNSAFLDFISNASSSFSLADPVTQGQIEVAKAIAKTLLSFNQNDEVLDIEFDLLPYDTGERHWKSNNSHSIPLKAGNYAIIKQEHCEFMSCFFQFTDKSNLNPIAWLADIALLIPTAFNKALFDNPDSSSMTPIDIVHSTTGYDGAVMDSKKLIGLHAHTNKLIIGKSLGELQGVTKKCFKKKSDVEKRLLTSVNSSNCVDTSQVLKFYQDKTWLTFTIQQGRDPELWDIRKELSDAEKRVTEMLRRKSISELVSDGDIGEAIKSLENAKKKAKEIEKNKFSVYLMGENARYIDDFKNQDICIAKPLDSKVAYGWFGGDSKTIINAISFGKNSRKTPLSNCYNFTVNSSYTIISGEYKLNLSVLLKGETTPVEKTFPLRLVDKPEVDKKEIINKEIVLTGKNLKIVEGLKITTTSDKEYTFEKKDIHQTDKRLSVSLPSDISAVDTIKKVNLTMPYNLAEIDKLFQTTAN